VPGALAAHTLELALAFAAGRAVGSASTAGLANAALRDLLLGRLRLAIMALSVGCLTVGAGVYLWKRTIPPQAALAGQTKTPHVRKDTRLAPPVAGRSPNTEAAVPGRAEAQFHRTKRIFFRTSPRSGHYRVKPLL
jgi:hypothetical protein